MKKISLFTAIMLLAASVSFCEESQLYTQKERWRMLQTGQAESQVEVILGSPEKISFEPIIGLQKYWDYSNGGRVIFGNGAVYNNGKVESWAEPDWTPPQDLLPVAPPFLKLSLTGTSDNDQKVFIADGITVKLRSHFGGFDYQIIYGKGAVVPAGVYKHCVHEEDFITLSGDFNLRFLDKDGYEVHKESCYFKDFICGNEETTLRGSASGLPWVYNKISSVIIDYQ